MLKLNKNTFLLRPIFIALVLFFLQLIFMYQEKRIFFEIAELVFVVISLIYGLIKISQKFFINGISHISASILLIVLFFPSLRLYEMHARHYIQFMIDKKKYEADIANMRSKDFRLMTWVWGQNSQFNYHLVFDESEKTTLSNSESSVKDPCWKRVYKIESHFYVVEDFCP